MSDPNERKRPRHVSPQRPIPGFRTLGGGVFQVISQEPMPLTVGNGDLYNAINTPGALIVDNSEPLSFADGLLLWPDSCCYLGFSSPSDYAAMRLSSSLQMFHDLAMAPLPPIYDQFGMVRLATRSKPSKHACIRLDFTDTKDRYFKGVAETLQAAEAFVNRVVTKAVKSFLLKYPSFPPAGLSYHGVSEPLLSFLDWFAATYATEKSSFASDRTTLFIAVHGLHNVVERHVHAAFSAELRPPALDDKWSIVQRLVLRPILKHLGATQGAVRKFLIVGPYLTEDMILLPESLESQLPEFMDLTDWGVHGFLPSQIRTLYSLPQSKMSHQRLAVALQQCNHALLVDEPMAVTYTKESVESVFNGLSKDPSLLDTGESGPLCAEYVKARHEAAAHALYPPLLRHPPFRAHIRTMLTTIDIRRIRQLTPGLSIDDLIDPAPSENNWLTRIFMLGLMCRIERMVGGRIRVRFMLAGGCARALLQRLYDETVPQTYTEKFLRRPPTMVPSSSKLPDGLDEYLDVGDFDICNPTEKSLADLILNFFRPLRQWKYMPTGEASLQMIVFHLLRAALIKKFGHTAFVTGLLRESWLRKPWRKVRRRSDAPPEIWEGFSDLCGDLIHSMTIKGQDFIIIYEFKWFDLGDTMNATHLLLADLDKTTEGPHGKLESQKLRPRGSIPAPDEDEYGWHKAADHFIHEISSMKDRPPDWHIDPSVKKVELGFPLQVKHLGALFNEHAGGDMKGSGISYNGLKMAVGIADGTVGQVAGYRDTGALGVADELAAFLRKTIATQEPSRDETDEPIHDELNLSDLPPGLFGWADNRITDMGPGCTVIRAFAIVCVAGSLAFVKELKETRTLARKIGIVDSSTWKEPEVADKKPMDARKVVEKLAKDANTAADDVHKRKQEYAREMKS